MREVPADVKARLRRVVPVALDVLGIFVTLGIGVAIVFCCTTELTAEEDALLRGLDVALLAYFVAEVVLRAVLAKGVLAALGARWCDLLALVALLHTFGGGRVTWSWFLVRQGAALAVAAARAAWVRRLAGRLWRHPGPLLAGSFAGAIIVGAALLTLPISSPPDQSITVVDALFTSTSAVCVTGLVVKDTGGDFTFFGKIVILTLIQLGGLGIMTFSVSMLLILGRRLSPSPGPAMQDMLDQESAREAMTLVRFITITTFAIEAVGAAALFTCFGHHSGYTVHNAFSAIFHAISAFCNAGFSLYSKNLEGFCGHVGVNLVITSLIILGGLGFPVLRDLVIVGRRRRLGEGRSPGLRTQTRVVLTTTAVLIVGGAALFYVLELPSTLKPLGPGGRVLASYFQSVTARTAGFNTVSIGAVRTPALVVLMLLMFIGASPGSTGGGIKTTTAAILFQAMRSAFRRRPEVELFGRTVPRATIRRSIALVMLSLLLLGATTVAITALERDVPFEKLLFEQVSAFGTVGLSTGAPKLTTSLSAVLSVPGKLIIVLLMFAGRVGPLTLMLSLVGEARAVRYKYPNTHMMVG